MKKWYYVSFVHDAINHQIRLTLRDQDAEVIFNQSSSYTPGLIPNTSEENVTIGGYSSSTGFLDGYIDELRISNNMRSFTPVSIDDREQIIETFELVQNYPNPFNPATTIAFTLPAKAHVRLEIFNLLGQTVAVLADDEFTAGTHEINWEASGAPSGVYFYRISASSSIITKKMILLK